MSNAIISLKPRHVNNVLDGTKTVELRSRPVNLCPGTRLWIYSTLPDGFIGAVATIDKIHMSSPNNIWRKYSNQIAISKKEYDGYVLGKEKVSAILLTDIKKIEPAISLDVLRRDTSNFHPPQFFKKLSPNAPLLDYLSETIKLGSLVNPIRDFC